MSCWSRHGQMSRCLRPRAASGSTARLMPQNRTSERAAAPGASTHTPVAGGSKTRVGEHGHDTAPTDHRLRSGVDPTSLGETLRRPSAVATRRAPGGETTPPPWGVKGDWPLRLETYIVCPIAGSRWHGFGVWPREQTPDDHLETSVERLVSATLRQSFSLRQKTSGPSRWTGIRIWRRPRDALGGTGRRRAPDAREPAPPIRSRAWGCGTDVGRP